jgi:hypothetical protein
LKSHKRVLRTFIFTCVLIIGSALVNLVKAEPVTESTEQVVVNDLVVWIEYTYDRMNISLVILNFTISPLYYKQYMPNFYIAYAKFEVLDISAPLNEEYGYVFNLTSEHALYSPDKISTALIVSPKAQEFPRNYIRVTGFLKFRNLKSLEWTIAVIPFTLHFIQYDYSNWWQLKMENNSLETRLSDSMNLMHTLTAATIVLLATTAFFGLEWRRQRKILRKMLKS